MGVDVEEAHVGQFLCSYDTLRLILGFPESTIIRNISTIPYALHAENCVRIVLEDPNIPEVKQGEEIGSVQPQFKIAYEFRQFNGWGLDKVEEPESIPVIRDDEEE